MLKNDLEKIIFKILYVFDRGIVLDQKLENFYHQNFYIFQTYKNTQYEFIFKTNNINLKLQKTFLDNLKKVKIENFQLTKYENLSYKDRNQIILNSYNGFYLFKIIVNYLKLED